ncbi:PREDICTED: jerky protein [Elephantulus edwardii]|uniref:jerky protein n=1 Tax=Elephantulus edwardii TaxID=28737 RepID=UPI0003F06D95|nr:PREDICTED: jerky protein [Elephantulus edwardii]
MASKLPTRKGSGEKRKRVVLTLKEKIDICSRLEKGESRRALMEEYNVAMSTLYDIKAHKAQLLRFFSNSDSSQALAQRRTLHTPKLEHLDRMLYQWFLLKRAEGMPISGPMLIEKAKDFYEQMQLTEPCVFSGGWLWRFKARHGIKKLDMASEKQVADRQAAEQFCSFFRSLVAEHGLSPEQLYNADEMGLFLRCLPHAAPDGGPGPGLKPGKDRLTVLMCANAAGSHKVKPLVVGKCGGPRALTGLQHVPVAYQVQGHAWVDKDIFSDWFHRVFVPSVKEHFRTVGLPEDGKAILLLDSSRAHPPETALAADSIFTIFLPAGVATLIQPMDQGVRRAFMQSFINPPVGLQDFHARYSIHDAMFHVACAWSSVPSTVLQRAWRKLWPSAVLTAGSSSEDEGAERVQGQEPSKVLTHILELVGDPVSHSNGGLQKGEAGEWTGTAEEVECGRVPTEPAPAVWDQGKAEGAGLELGAEDAWERAAASFHTVLDFAERQPCFSAQERSQLQVLHAAFTRQRRARQRGALGAAVKTEAACEGSLECAPGCPAAACPLLSTSVTVHGDS